MATFQTHLSAGLTIGYMASVASVAFHWASSSLTALLVFAATCVGSLMPDLDSDNSTPFSITFGILSVLAGCLAFLYCVQTRDMLTERYWFVVPPLVALFVRFGVGRVFQVFTVHRGIFHSLPMTLIVTGLMPLVLRPLRLGMTDVLAISMGTGMGFLTHLVLDEIYAAVDFSGHRIGPKKSFGTAVALIGASTTATVCAYAALATLTVLNWPLIRQGIAMAAQK